MGWCELTKNGEVTKRGAILLLWLAEIGELCPDGYRYLHYFYDQHPGLFDERWQGDHCWVIPPPSRNFSHLRFFYYPSHFLTLGAKEKKLNRYRGCVNLNRIVHNPKVEKSKSDGRRHYYLRWPHWDVLENGVLWGGWTGNWDFCSLLLPAHRPLNNLFESVLISMNVKKIE